MADKKFGSRTFRVGTVLASDAIALKVRLLRIVGSGVDQLPVILAGRTTGASAEQKSSSDAAAVKAVQDMFASTSDEGVVTLIRDILSLATVQRPSSSWESVDLDGDFTEREHQQYLYAVIVWILSEVFSGFFTGLKAVGNLTRSIKTG